MRLVEELPWWTTVYLICGNEGNEGEGEGGEGGGDAGDGSSDDDASSEGSEEDEGAEDEGRDTAGLKSALRKERKAAKDAARELKEARKRLEELDAKDKTEVERAKAAQEKADAKVTKLAESLKNQAINSAIETVAREMKFRDVDDAVSLVSRRDIEVEQDDDNPAEVRVDTKTVKAAVKALADRKKHLIDAGGEEDPSGSKFGGKGGNKHKQTEEELKKKYSALQ